MHDANIIVSDAVDTSVLTDSFVTVDRDVDVLFLLGLLCEDSAESDEVTEFWGTDEDGSAWRVHVRV